MTVGTEVDTVIAVVVAVVDLNTLLVVLLLALLLLLPGFTRQQSSSVMLGSPTSTGVNRWAAAAAINALMLAFLDMLVMIR